MEKIIIRLLKKPVYVVIITVLITLLFFAAAGKNTRLETKLANYMPQNHPAFVYSDLAEEQFNIRDGIIIAIEHEDSIYNPSTLAKIKGITEELQAMDEIHEDDVLSLYTADNITGDDFGLDVSPFYTDIPESESDISSLRELVRTNDMVFKRIVSENEKAALIMAEIDDDVFTPEFHSTIIKLAESYEGAENIYVSGRPVIEGTLAYLAPKDMARMVPVVLFIISIVLYLVLRSIRAWLLTLLVVILSTLWTFGLKAMLGIPVYAVSTMIPVMLIAIGVADGIHLFLHLKIYMEENPQADKFEAVKEMIGSMWKPVVMTSVTTAAGFIALVTSEVYPIKYFGLFTAFGVMAAMLFSLFLIPAGILLAGLPKWRKRDKGRSGKNRETDIFQRFSVKILKYKYTAILVTAIVTASSIAGIGMVWIDSSFLSNFEKNSEIVKTDTFINNLFGGTSTLSIILESEDSDAFKQPEILRVVDNLQKDTVMRIPEAGNSFSIADYLKRMNKVMNEDNPLFHTIPETSDLAAQYLLLYEMSGDPENLWKTVDYDFKSANVTIQLKNDTSKTLREVLSVIDSHLPELEKLGLTVNYAGSGYKALVFTDLILEGQIKSVFISLVLAVILLSLMFKSITAGLIGAVPISVSALVNFGLMGITGIPLSTTTALLSSIAIGVGIDYAVHFIEKYREFSAAAGNIEEASSLAMKHSGRAIFFNAAVVISGFSVLMLSLFPPNRSLGALISLNMAVSLAGTLTIMYILLRMSRVFNRPAPIKSITGV